MLYEKFYNLLNFVENNPDIFKRRYGISESVHMYRLELPKETYMISFYLDLKSFRWSYSLRRCFEIVSFEKVFNEMPYKMKQRFIFNLDLFS